MRAIREKTSYFHVVVNGEFVAECDRWYEALRVLEDPATPDGQVSVVLKLRSTAEEVLTFSSRKPGLVEWGIDTNRRNL